MQVNSRRISGGGCTHFWDMLGSGTHILGIWILSPSVCLAKSCQGREGLLCEFGDVPAGALRSVPISDTGCTISSYPNVCRKRDDKNWWDLCRMESGWLIGETQERDEGLHAVLVRLSTPAGDDRGKSWGETVRKVRRDTEIGGKGGRKWTEKKDTRVETELRTIERSDNVNKRS